jgi:hypothetical protein
LSVIYVATGKLKPNPNNARDHTPRQVRQIAESLKAFQFNAPILADREDMIIAGHGRWLAAKLLGWAEVPVIRLADLTPEQVKAYAIADNRLTDNSVFNERQLALHLKALSELDLDFSLEATGFTIGEIDLRIEGLDEGGSDPDPDDEPLPPGPSVCRSGDLFLLGDHRLLNGSALEPASYDLLLEGELADGAFLDPPYGGSIQGYLARKGRQRHREFVQGSVAMTPAELAAFLNRAAQLVAEYSTDRSVAFWCMDFRHLETMLAAGRLAYAELLNLCVWAKDKGGMGALYRSAHELVLVYRKGREGHRNNVQLGRFGRNRTNVWSYPGANQFVRASGDADLLSQHPTPKPVELVADALLDVTARRDLILDVFLGSGTTLIACERVGRRCRGLELDPLYIDLAIRRWQRLTGEDAIHAASGRPFNDLAAEASGEP